MPLKENQNFQIKAERESQKARGDTGKQGGWTIPSKIRGKNKCECIRFFYQHPGPESVFGHPDVCSFMVEDLKSEKPGP